MSEKTAVEQFADSVLSYKNPTNLNGTDYIMISINKVEYLKEKFKAMEKEQIKKSWFDSLVNYDENKTFEEYYKETFKNK